ncbi:peptidoglycan DD-metalloendopeptidase family protein [Negadavirga shengliensis]|uniref:Peptidoglycan DD-metalloendopeptidase family protein n=1 Tax=Negadavirga shengliensis TaxID=1389218 RepID=A0ABV9SXP0_9BACT
MGAELHAGNTFVLDLSKTNPKLNEVDFVNNQNFIKHIERQMEENKAMFAVGGYGENRQIYSRSQVFAQASMDYRNIHLGIDIWTAAGHPVYCPVGGLIHGFKDNIGFGNYGPTVILEHRLHNDIIIYSLYGHLSRRDLANLAIGKKIRQGEKIGHLGSTEENGGWPPHLHFQLIRNLQDYHGDYPGVCGEKDKTYYLSNCPDPNIWLGCPLLK